MPNYINPGTIGNGLGYKSPTMGGALTGLGLGYQTKMLDQDIRDSDLGFMAKMHEFEQSKLDDPAKAAERDAAIAKAGTDTTWNQSGQELEKRRAAIEEVKAQTESMKTSNEMKKKEQKDQFIVDLGDLLDRPWDQSNEGDRKDYGDLIDQAGKHGITLPGWPNDATKSAAKQRAEIAVNNLQQRRTALDESRKNSYALGQTALKGILAGNTQLATTQIKADAAKEISSGRNATLSHVAAIKAQSIAPKTLEAQAILHMGRNETAALEQDVDALWIQELKDPGVQIKAIGEDGEAFKEQWKANKKAQLQAIVAEKKAQAGSPAGESPAVSTPAPAAAPVPAKVKAMSDADFLAKARQSPKNKDLTDEQLLDAGRKAGYR